MPTIYLDTNEGVRIFQRDPAGALADRVVAAVARGWHLVLSDVFVIEFAQGIDAGADVQQVTEGLWSIDTLSPLWIHLASLEQSELDRAIEQFSANQPFTPATPILEWRAMANALDLGGPTRMPTALLDQYTRGNITDRLHHWADELARCTPDARQEMASGQFADAANRLFRNIARYYAATVTARLEPNAADAFADTLWKDRAACPAFRLQVNTQARIFRDRNRRWRMNDYLDAMHALAVPYVDAFVANDAGLRDTIRHFDANHRQTAGLAPYQGHLYVRVEDVPNFL